MNDRLKQSGFSLTEVLISVGILSVGMMLIATMFPVALYLTAVASERTMAAIVADEAFAKIQLYGLSTFPPGISDYNNMSKLTPMDPNEYSYPAVDPCSTDIPQYYWSALCRDLGNREYRVTVFIARKTGPNLTYQGGGEAGKRPKAVIFNMNIPADANLLQVDANTINAKYINPPTTVLDNATGKLYRVIDRRNSTVTLDRAWENAKGAGSIWLIPPPETGGKNADIEVYQRIIRF